MFLTFPSFFCLIHSSILFYFILFLSFDSSVDEDFCSVLFCGSDSPYVLVSILNQSLFFYSSVLFVRFISPFVFGCLASPSTNPSHIE